MAKTYEVAFNINARLQGNLSSAINAANAQIKNLRNAASSFKLGDNADLQRLSRLSRQAQDAAKYTATQQEAAKTQQAMSAAAAQAAKIQRYFNQDAQAVTNLKSRLEQLNEAQRQQSETANAERANLTRLREERRQLLKEYRQSGSDKSAVKSKLQQNQIKIDVSASNLAAARTNLQNLRSQVRELKAELKTAEAAMKSSANNLKNVQRNASDLAATLQRQQSAISSLSASLNNAGFSTANFANSEARLRSEIEQTTAALQRQAAQQARIQSVHNRLDNASNNFSESQGAFQTAKSVAGSLLNPFKSAIDNAANYEYELANVKALSQIKDIRAGNIDQVNANMASLDKLMRHLGATTEYTSTQAAQAAGYFAMAGWDTKRIEAVLPAFVNLATATSTSGDQFARLADVFSDDMTAVGLKAGEMVKLKSGLQMEASQYFADAFAYATTNANLNTESLHEGVKYFAPIANTLGLEVSEMMATTMLTANAGIKGSQMGTAFRAGLIRMVAPTKGAIDKLNEMGEALSMSDAQKGFQEAQQAMADAGITGDTFSEKIQSMAQYLQTLDKDNRIAFLDKVFGKNAISAWAKILENPESVGEILKNAAFMESDQIQGYSQSTAAVKRDSTHVQIELVKSALDAIENNIGTALLPSITSISQALGPVLTNISEFIAANPAIVQGLAATAAGLSAIMVGGAGLAVAFSAFEFGAAQIAMFRLAASGAEVASAGMAARLGGLVATLRGLSFAGVATSISTAFGGIATAIGGALKASMAFAFSPIGAGLMLLAAAAYAVYENWENVAPVLSNVGNMIMTSLAPAFSAVQSAVQNAFTAFSSIGDAIAPAISAVKALFGELSAENPMDFLVQCFIAGVSTIGQVLAVAINFVANFVATIVNAFAGVGKAISQAINGDFSAAFDTFKGTVSNAFSGVGDTFSSSFNMLKKIPQNTRNALNQYELTKGDAGGSFAVQNAANTATVANNATSNVQNAANTATVANNATSNIQNAANTAAVANSATSNIQNAANTATVANSATANVQNAGLSQEIASMAQSYGFDVDAGAVNAALNEMAANANTSATAFNENAAVISQNSASQSENAANLQNLNLSAAESAANLSNNAVAAVENAANLSASSMAAIENAAAASANSASLTEMGGAASASVGNISNLSSSSASASSSLSGLGGAASSAISALMSAAAGVGSAISGALSSAASSVSSFFGGGVAQNAQGGIYNHGAFLTWFAEKSPEAAIPLDGSSRAVELWKTAGAILGVYPAENYAGGIYDVGGAVMTKGVGGVSNELSNFNLSNILGGLNVSNVLSGLNVSNALSSFNLSNILGGLNVSNALSSLNLSNILGGLNVSNVLSGLNVSNALSSLNLSNILGGLNVSNVLESLGGDLVNFEGGEGSFAPVININFSINISGNADAADVQRGLESALPQVQDSFENQLREFYEEYRRRAFY